MNRVDDDRTWTGDETHDEIWTDGEIGGETWNGETRGEIWIAAY